MFLFIIAFCLLFWVPSLPPPPFMCFVQFIKSSLLSILGVNVFPKLKKKKIH